MRTVTAALFTAAVVVACAGSTDPTTAPYWVDRLDDQAQRIDALKELGKLADKTAVPAVLKWFEEEGDWQPDAAYALGQLGDPSVAQALVQSIDYQVGTGRDKATTRKNRTNQNIARALALLEAKDGVEPLVNLLKTQELKTREAVIRSLGDIGDHRATGPLVKIALNESQPFIRKTAIQALGDLGDPAATGALIQDLFVELPGTSFYYEARYSLLQIGRGAVPLLIQTLERKNKDVESIRLGSGEKIADGAIEAKAAFVLGTMRAKKADTAMVEAVEKYYGRYQSAGGGPVFAGIIGAVMEFCFALGNLGSDAAIPILEKIALDKDPNIRVSATEALTAIGARGAVGTMLEAAKTGPVAARRHAVVAVSRLGSGKDLAAYNALAKAGGKDIKPAVMKKILAQSRARLEAAKACDSNVECWQGKLTDKNTVVRERAAWELGWAGKKEAIPTLMKAAEDDENDVRLAAVSSLNLYDDGVDPDALQAIYDKWSQKIAYKNTNANLRRVIARLRAQKSNGK